VTRGASRASATHTTPGAAPRSSRAPHTSGGLSSPHAAVHLRVPARVGPAVRRRHARRLGGRGGERRLRARALGHLRGDERWWESRVSGKHESWVGTAPACHTTHRGRAPRLPPTKYTLTCAGTSSSASSSASSASASLLLLPPPPPAAAAAAVAVVAAAARSTPWRCASIAVRQQRRSASSPQPPVPRSCDTTSAASASVSDASVRYSSAMVQPAGSARGERGGKGDGGGSRERVWGGALGVIPTAVAASRRAPPVAAPHPAPTGPRRGRTTWSRTAAPARGSTAT
jgi:hypothetical protein